MDVFEVAKGEEGIVIHFVGHGENEGPFAIEDHGLFDQGFPGVGFHEFHLGGDAFDSQNGEVGHLVFDGGDGIHSDDGVGFTAVGASGTDHVAYEVQVTQLADNREAVGDDVQAGLADKGKDGGDTGAAIEEDAHPFADKAICRELSHFCLGFAILGGALFKRLFGVKALEGKAAFCGALDESTATECFHILFDETFFGTCFRNNVADGNDLSVLQ